jgi:hypothetical protein
METQKKKGGALKAIVSIAILIAVVWFFFGGGLENQAAKQMDEIHNQVADDAIKQYEIVKKNGNEIECYTQASLVAAAFLQAQDEANYNKWKEIEKTHAKAAGLQQ